MTVDLLADPMAPELDWPHVRRAVLGCGGIAPSPDYDNADWPADLLRGSGQAPDVVAVEALITSVGGHGVVPWGEDAGPDAMRTYLWRAWRAWESAPASQRYTLQETPRMRAARERGKARRAMAAEIAKPKPLQRGVRSFAELVAELKRKHGAEVDLSGLNPEYVKPYETGKRITIEKRTAGSVMVYRGTVGATRGARPRFVLLLSMDL